jgi:hypothetical protein
MALTEFTFKVGGDENIDLSLDQTTDSQSLCGSYQWSINATSGDVVGVPTYTIEVSNDDSTWYEYNNDSTNVAFTDAVDDNHFAFKYIRLVITSNGSTGTGIWHFTGRTSA